MRFRFISVPIQGSAAAEAELNDFLATHRIVAVDRHLVADGARSAWAVCVTYVERSTSGSQGAEASKKGRVDYRELLSDVEFQRFVKLRELRKKLAEREGVPPYAPIAPDNRNDNIGFRLARAQKRVGRPTPDPTRAVSVPTRHGEIQAGVGVQVAAADAPSNARRWPTFARSGR